MLRRAIVLGNPDDGTAIMIIGWLRLLAHITLRENTGRIPP
jgi:hypothetical protein